MALNCNICDKPAKSNYEHYTANKLIQKLSRHTNLARRLYTQHKNIPKNLTKRTPPTSPTIFSTLLPLSILIFLIDALNQKIPLHPSNDIIQLSIGITTLTAIITHQWLHWRYKQTLKKWYDTAICDECI